MKSQHKKKKYQQQKIRRNARGAKLLNRERGNTKQMLGLQQTVYQCYVQTGMGTNMSESYTRYTNVVSLLTRLSEKSFVLLIQYPPDFAARSAASRPDIFYPKIHVVNLWQVYILTSHATPICVVLSVHFADLSPWTTMVAHACHREKTSNDRTFVDLFILFLIFFNFND